MSDDETAQGVVLDVLAHGRSDDDRPGYQRQPVAYVMGEDDFQLYELRFSSPPNVTIGDTIDIEPTNALENVEVRNAIEYDDLSSNARSEVEYAVNDILEANEQRFLDFFNSAQPVSLRLHQLNLLPGIGDKLRDGILDARKRQPFSDFDDLATRVSGLHDPESILVERIMDELTEPEMKYYLFVGPDALLAQR